VNGVRALAADSTHAWGSVCFTARNNTCLMQALLAVPVDMASSEDSSSGSSALHLLLRYLISSSWRAVCRHLQALHIRSTYEYNISIVAVSGPNVVFVCASLATQHGTLTLRLFCCSVMCGAVLLQPPAGVKVSKRDAAGVVSQPVPAVPGHWQDM
jgi:hypothetical protein